MKDFIRWFEEVSGKKWTVENITGRGDGEDGWCYYDNHEKLHGPYDTEKDVKRKMSNHFNVCHPLGHLESN